jgi:hypothetical protein
VTDDGTRLGRELADLERTDPDVAAAAARLQDAVDAVLVRGDVPRSRFRPSTPDRPCEVLR